MAKALLDVGERRDLWSMVRTAAPLIGINLSITGMQFVDAWMVSGLGEDALAAILPATMFFYIPLHTGLGVLTALIPLISQAIGRGEPAAAGRIANQGLYLALGLGLAMLALWPAAPWLFAFLQHAPEVQRLEIDYFRWSLLGAVPTLAVGACSNFFTAIQRPGVLLPAAILATGLNVVFNFVLINGHLGLPALGIVGAALGTVLATVCQLGYLWCHYRSASVRTVYGTRALGVIPAVHARLIRIGLPSGTQTAFDLFTWGVVLSWMIGLFGTEALAANTIVVRYIHIAFMPPLALASILSAQIGTAIGGGRPEDAVRLARIAYRGMVAYMLACGAFFLICAPTLVGLFTADPAILRTAWGIFACVAVYQFFDAQYITYTHALRGAGDTLWPSLVMICCSLGILLAGGLALVHWLPAWGAVGPWVATAAYTVAVGLLSRWRWKQGRWRTLKL